MRNNTAFNQSSPGGGSPGIHIYQRRLINPTQAEVIEQAVNAAVKWWKPRRGCTWK